MAIRPILIHPDPRLRARAAPVGAVTPEVRGLAADMLETMYAAPGRGLAAPQVGVGLRLFVMDVAWREGAPAPVVAIDPELAWTSVDVAAGEEACLSIPGAPRTVTRPVEVRMAWTDLSGARAEHALGGAAARCAQHELDHLGGVLILDRA